MGDVVAASEWNPESERKDLIERHPDRRAIRVRLTEAGRELVDRAVVDHVTNEERTLAPLSAADRPGAGRGIGVSVPYGWVTSLNQRVERPRKPRLMVITELR
ncbi:hypothetical protein [Streptomyces sp. Je 1-332]|uniref:MarR family winged helix-turn-helix transcriptional regulator n=1 Tax=Streptomyces sp. Je 1-332 TaxID=3231270 RepID=UPI003458A3C4